MFVLVHFRQNICYLTFLQFSKGLLRELDNRNLSNYMLVFAHFRQNIIIFTLLQFQTGLLRQLDARNLNINMCVAHFRQIQLVSHFYIC